MADKIRFIFHLDFFYWNYITFYSTDQGDFVLSDISLIIIAILFMSDGMNAQWG